MSNKDSDPFDRVFGWFFVVVAAASVGILGAFIYLAVEVAQWIGRQ